MTIKSFPHGIPFSSSFAISASYVPSASFIGPTASLAEFVTGFIGPSGSVGKTIDNSGQFTIVPSYPIQMVGVATNTSGALTFPPHQAGDLIILMAETDYVPTSANPHVFLNISQSSILQNWIEAEPTTINPIGVGVETSFKISTIVFKFASSSAEPFPEFSGTKPISNTSAIIYRGVDLVTHNVQSRWSGNGSYYFYTTFSQNFFTPYRDSWIVYLNSATRRDGITNLESLFGVPRDGFVNRIVAYSGSLSVPSASIIAIADSNMPTASIGTVSAGTTSVSSSFVGAWLILRAGLDYSQFYT